MVAHRHAARHLDVDELVVAGLRGDQPAALLEPSGAVVRVGDAQLGEVARQARHVLVEAKQAPPVHRQHLVHTVAEDETAVEHADLGLGQRAEAAIEVAQAVGKGLCHASIIGRWNEGLKQLSQPSVI